VSHRIVSLLRLVNVRTAELVLGAEAMQTAELKSITAKHLAMAAQTMLLLGVVVPMLHDALALRLPAAHVPLLSELDRVSGDLDAHHQRLTDKLLALAEMVCKSACGKIIAELSQAEPNGGSDSSERVGGASAAVTKLVKDTAMLRASGPTSLSSR